MTVTERVYNIILKQVFVCVAVQTVEKSYFFELAHLVGVLVFKLACPLVACFHLCLVMATTAIFLFLSLLIRWANYVLPMGDFILFAFVIVSQGVFGVMMEEKDQRAYTMRHVWALPSASGNSAHVGLTDYLTEELQAISSIDLPLVGDELDIDNFCIHLHIGSRIHHLRSPLTGRVQEINKDVLDNPSLLHLNPFKHWLYRMEFDDPEELDLLMSTSQYQRYLDMI